jgi:hypothetical protein
MNPDVFITIAFVGIAVLVPLVALALVVPRTRRDDDQVARSSHHERARTSPRELSEDQTATQRGNASRH